MYVAEIELWGTAATAEGGEAIADAVAAATGVVRAGFLYSILPSAHPSLATDLSCHDLLSVTARLPLGTSPFRACTNSSRKVVTVASAGIVDNMHVGAGPAGVGLAYVPAFLVSYVGMRPINVLGGNLVVGCIP